GHPYPLCAAVDLRLPDPERAITPTLPSSRGRRGMALSGGSFPEQSEQAPLFGGKLVGIGIIFLVDGLEATGKVGGDHRGMDVALLRDGGRITELVGDPGDGANELLLGPARIRRSARLAEESSREDRPGPGAEILGAEILTADLSQVVVDVGRIDGLHLALVVDALEELLPGDVEKPLDDPRHAAVVEFDAVVLAALAAKGEADLGPDDVDVSVAQGRQPIGAVFPPVLVVPDPDPRLLQQANHGCQHLLPRQAGLLEVSVGALADLRKRLRKGEHAIVLDRVADLAPAGVIAI